MKMPNDTAAILFIGIILGIFIGLSIGSNIQRSIWRVEMVNRGLATHCPIDGRFAFNGECKQ